MQTLIMQQDNKTIVKKLKKKNNKACVLPSDVNKLMTPRTCSLPTQKAVI